MLRAILAATSLLLPCSALAQSGVHYDSAGGGGGGLATTGGTLTGNVQLSCPMCWLYQPAQTSDAAPNQVVIKAGDSWNRATSTNQSGGNLNLLGGTGSIYLTVSDYTKSAADQVCVNINGVCTARVEGVGFTCVGTSNNTCASNLATAVSAITGVSATAVGAVVYVQPTAASTRTLTLSITDGAADGAFATATNSAPGSVVVGHGQLLTPDGTSTLPGMAFTAQPGTGIYRAGNGIIGIATSGLYRMALAAGTSTIYTDLKFDGTYPVLNSTNGAPGATACDNDAERGRMSFDYSTNKIYVCSGAGGWKTYSAD